MAEQASTGDVGLGEEAHLRGDELSLLLLRLDSEQAHRHVTNRLGHTERKQLIQQLWPGRQLVLLAGLGGIIARHVLDSCKFDQIGPDGALFS